MDYQTTAATILVIDDDPLVRSAICRALRAVGHGCVAAADAAQGLEQARETRPDVIVLDIGLPDTDGRDLLYRLRGDPSVSDIPVVVVSGDIDQYRRMQALEAGAEDVVEKPFDAVMLERKLSWLVSKRRMAAATAVS